MSSYQYHYWYIQITSDTFSLAFHAQLSIALLTHSLIFFFLYKFSFVYCCMKLYKIQTPRQQQTLVLNFMLQGKWFVANINLTNVERWKLTNLWSEVTSHNTSPKIFKVAVFPLYNILVLTVIQKTHVTHLSEMSS